MDVKRPALLACFAAILSIALQGFEFGINNNVFHIPIVLRMYDLPQFAHDPVMQSLHKFVSPVYPLLAHVATEANIVGLFFACHVLTRVLTFYALILIMVASGLAEARLWVGAMILVFTGIYGFSPVGGDGMLIEYFTHTELAQAFALISASFIMRRRLVAAALASAVAFDINIFVGVWMLAPLGIASLLQLGRKSGKAKVLREIALAAAVFFIVVMPVVLWVRSVVHEAPPTFDFRGYLRFYFPKHFFLDASSLSSIAKVLEIALLGILAVRFLRPGGAQVVVGWMIVFAVGAMVGAMVHSTLLLRLHLLRVDGLLVIGGVTLAVSAALSMWDLTRVGRSVASAAILYGLVTAQYVVPIVALLLLIAAERGHGEKSAGVASLRIRVGAWLRAISARPRPYAVAASALLVVYGTLDAYATRTGRLADGAIPTAQDDELFEGQWPRAPQWREVQLWARHTTSPDATFLVPLWPLGFRVGAQRVAWVDAKDGATVFWAPETYDTWHSRFNEVRALRTLHDQLTYALAHGLSYVVVDKRSVTPDPGHSEPAPLFSNAVFAVYAAQPG